MKKKQFVFDPDQTAEQSNARAVTAVLNKARKPHPTQTPDQYPTKTQTLEPLPGQASLFEPGANRHPAGTERVIIRRKSDEKRTKHKQLLISPDAYKNLRERAENEDTTINNCLSALLASAIISGMKVKREKAGQPKTCRQIAIFTPSLLEEIETTAAAQGVSLNEFICFVLENCERVIL